jgi:hypothetical protein
VNNLGLLCDIRDICLKHCADNDLKDKKGRLLYDRWLGPTIGEPAEIVGLINEMLGIKYYD